MLVLAVDMPRVTPGTFARLTEALVAPEAARAPDRTARCWSTPAAAASRSARSTAPPRCSGSGPTTREDEHGLPVHRLVGALELVEVAAVADEAHDVDTWADLQELRERAEDLTAVEPGRSDFGGTGCATRCVVRRWRR